MRKGLFTHLLTYAVRYKALTQQNNDGHSQKLDETKYTWSPSSLMSEGRVPHTGPMELLRLWPEPEFAGSSSTRVYLRLVHKKTFWELLI